MLRIIAFLAATCCAAGASVIDSGTIVTHYSFGQTDGPFEAVQLSPADGHFLLWFRGTGATDFECLCDTSISIPIGASGPMRASTSSIGTASAVVGGTRYQDFALYWPGLWDTSLSLTSSDVTITGPGSYMVPFTVSGVLQGGSRTGATLLNETVAGSGVLTFSVGRPAGFNGPLSFVGDFKWTFTAVPEPAPALMLTGGLFVFIALSQRVRLRKGRAHR